MKILRLTTFLDFGGIESKMVNLSTINDHQNEWIFIAIGKGGKAQKCILDNGKKVDILNLSYRIPSLVTIWKLYKYFKKEKPNVLHASGAEANFHGFFAAKLAGIPNIIVEEIGIPNHSRKAQIIFNYIFKRANFVVGESETVTKHISKTYGLREKQARTIHNFGIFNVDFSKIKRVQNSDAFQIIMISRLEPVKNIEGVIQVIENLVKDKIKIKLSIAGTGSLDEKLKKLVKEKGIENNVIFLGLITDPYPHLVNSDLYLLNSFSEGFSNSLIEAIYSKTLSLSTNVGAGEEIIEDGVTGFLVPADNQNALYDKLKNIIALTKEERCVIAEQGSKFVVENFSFKKHVEELMKIYK